MFRRIKENYNFDKEHLSNVRFKLKYAYLPIYFLINALIFLGCLLLLLNKPEPIIQVAILLILSLFSTVLILLLIRKTKRQEVEDESEKLKLFFAEKLLNKPEMEYVLPADGPTPFVNLTFGQDGIKIADLQYSFDAFDVALYTSNFMHQVNLILMFTRNEKGDIEDADNNGVSRFTLPFDLNLVSIVNKFKIKIQNPDVLSFIKDNPKLASHQILEYGKVQDNYRGEAKEEKNKKTKKSDQK